MKLNLVKDGGIDKEASIKFLEEHVTDDDWRKVYKDSLERCIPEMTARSYEFQNKSGVAIESCNYVYSAVLMCMDISTFMVRMLVEFIVSKEHFCSYVLLTYFF